MNETNRDKNGHATNEKGNLVFDPECRNCDAPPQEEDWKSWITLRMPFDQAEIVRIEYQDVDGQYRLATVDLQIKTGAVIRGEEPTLGNLVKDLLHSQATSLLKRIQKLRRIEDYPSSKLWLKHNAALDAVESLIREEIIDQK